MPIIAIGLALGVVAGLIDCWISSRIDSPFRRVGKGKRRYVSHLNCILVWMFIFGVVSVMIAVSEGYADFVNTPVDAVDVFGLQSRLLPQGCDRALSSLTGCAMSK